jgi:hypothetical protein
MFAHRRDRGRPWRDRRRIGRLLIALLTLPAAGPATAGTLSLATGLDVSSGKYGEAVPTTIVNPSLAIKYLESEWAIGMTVPYLQTSGPSNIVPGLGTSVSSLQRHRGSPEKASVMSRSGRAGPSSPSA